MIEAAIIGVIVIMIIFSLAILASLFWFWMIIDCIKRKNYEDKLVWVLVLLFLGVAGAIMYYFIAKEKPKKKR
jgi:hypothetical protein